VDDYVLADLAVEENNIREESMNDCRVLLRMSIHGIDPQDSRIYT